MRNQESSKLTFMEKFSYGLGDCSANVIVALTGTFLSAYYTDTIGIAAAAVGTMLLVCRVFDGGSDLLMGALVDKTNSRFGKARPWMLWTAPLMAIGIYLLFNCPTGLSEHGNLVYAYLTYIFMMVIVYTARQRDLIRPLTKPGLILSRILHMSPIGHFLQVQDTRRSVPS